MKTLVKCEICNAEVLADKCVFATHRKIIEGKEYVCCCRVKEQKREYGRFRKK